MSKNTINRKAIVQSSSSHVIYDDMIANVMPTRGTSYLKEDLFNELESRFGGNRHKAAGSLGGSSKGKFIKADGPYYVSTRDAYANR